MTFVFFIPRGFSFTFWCSRWLNWRTLLKQKKYLIIIVCQNFYTNEGKINSVRLFNANYRSLRLLFHCQRAYTYFSMKANTIIYMVHLWWIFNINVFINILLSSQDLQSLSEMSKETADSWPQNNVWTYFYFPQTRFINTCCSSTDNSLTKAYTISLIRDFSSGKSSLPTCCLYFNLICFLVSTLKQKMYLTKWKMLLPVQ